MNEDFLKALYANMGGDKVGSFDEFKNEFQSNEEFQKAVHANMGGDNVGSFDEFKSELFGAATKKTFNENPTIRFAPEQDAFLDTVADVESTGYNVIVSPKGKKLTFTDYSKHPEIIGVVTDLGPSTAAGMYQFTASTWNEEIIPALGLKDFSPDSQRIGALYYAETRYKALTGGRDFYKDLADGRLETIQQVLGGSGGATVWQGLQGDTEFAERYKSHLKRYQDQVKPPEPKTMQEAAQDLESAMQGNKEMAANLQYNLGETTVEPTPKKVPEDMGKIKERLDQERVSLKAVDHDFKQKVSTRQDELWGQFEQTPVAKSIQEKYANEYSTHFKKSEENVKATPEFLGLQQKIQDDVNRRVITPDEGNAKLTEYLNEKISADQSLSEIKLDIDGRLKDESLSVFQGYTSKDEILGSLIKQREDIWGQSTAFQTELINSYNSKIEDYNKQAQSKAQANQPKASKEVGLQGGGPYAPGQRPQDYTGGLIKINKTSSDYDKEEAELDAKFGLKKDAALAAWYTDQGREVPTQKAKDLTKKSTEYFKKGKEIKLKRYEALKQEIFTMSPIELGRAKIEDFTQKVQEYGDIQRGYFEQDNVAVQAYADELVKFREGADLKLSEKFGDKYNEFLEDQAALEIQIKAGRDVKDKVKNFQEKYSDVLEDDDYLLSSREIPKLYQQAKFEQSQLADAYQQGERLKRVEETQKYANENPVMAAIAGTLGKAIGAITQTTGSLLEQAEKAPLLVKLIPGFAQLSGFLPKGSLEKGISELGEMGRVAGGDIKAGTPLSTKMQGQSFETYAVTPTGKRVVYSPNTGQVQYIRNEDGTLYEGYEADVIIKSAEGLKKQQALNPFSLIGQMLDIGAEMIPTIALSYGTAGAGAAAGLGSTGAGVMSKMGMFMGGYSQGYSQAKEEALKQKGLSFDQAEAFAVTTGLITGAIENFNPLEGRIFSKSLSKSVIKDNLLELASGRVSGVNWADNITINFLKGGLKESLLEEVPQAFADNALKNYYNSKKGGEFATDVSSDQWKDIILTSFAMGGIGDAMRSGSKSDLGKEALKVLVNNREMYDAYISGMEKTSPEMAAKIRSDIDPLLSEIDSVDGLTPKRKEKSVELLYDIRTLESKLAPIVEPTLRKPIEDQIVELRKELGSVVSVPTDDYGDPVDEVAEAEKAAKEAEKTGAKVTKPTPKKPEEPPTPPAPAAAAVAVEETKNKKAEEFNDVEIISDYSETPVTYKGESGTLRKDGQTWTVETPTTIYDLDGVSDNTTLSTAGVQIADKITPNEDGSFSIRGKEFSNMFSDPMSAITLNEDGSYTVRLDTKGDNPKPRNFRGQLAEDLAYQITLQKITKEDAKGFEEYISNADANGEIPSPVSETKVGTDAEVPKAKKQRIKNAPESTISTEQGSTTTQGEKVAPTQPQEAQNANVGPITKKDLKGLSQTKMEEIYNSLPKDVSDKHFNYGVSGVNAMTPVKFYSKLKNAVGEEAANNIVRGIDSESSKRAAETTQRVGVAAGVDVVELSNGNKLVLNKDRSVKAGKNFTFDENSYDVQDKNGNKIGNIHISDRGDYYQISNVNIKNERAGLGTEIYETIIKQLDKPLISDKALSEKAKGLWDKLVKKGIAEKFEDTFELGGKTYTEDRYRTKVEQQPAAQTPTTKTKDKETTTTPNPIKTELENIGKTPKQIQEQIYKYFTSRIPGLPEDKARELAVSTYVMWDSIGRTLGGAKGIDFIQKKLAQIGQISTAKEAERMARDAGGSVKFQEAQKYFTRNADRLPLTLAVFNRPEFKELIGKIVNPITILNKLNQTGIKAAEKDLIKGIIEENFKGENKIDYNELEAVVRANIMPLERIFTSSYSSYGMNRLSGDYGEANTIILNAPIEHGFTGNHFPNAFKNSGRKDIKYIPKQLDANTWVAVEEGYETRGANANNIYQFVGTAGSKKSVENWIDEYENRYTLQNTKVEETMDTYILRDKSGKRLYYLNKTDLPTNPSKELVHDTLLSVFSLNSDESSSINKGMFGHIRTWVKDKIFTVAELQSDYFQNNNAKKSILEYDNIFNVVRQKINIEFQKYSKKLRDDAEEATTAELESIVRKLNSLKTYDKTKFTLVKGITAINYHYEGGDYGQYFITENTDYDDLYNEFSNRIFPNEKESVINEITTMFSPIFKINDKLEQDINAIRTRLEKDVDKKVTEIQNDKYNELTPQEKQFIASQKSWEQRMVREAIKEASLSGATKLRFPTPYTLSVIEGYISEDNKLPYRIKSSDTRDLKAGDTIEYLDKDHIVVASTDNTISVVQKDTDITDLIIDDIRAEKDEEDFINKNKLSNKRKFYRGVMNYDGKPLFLDYSDTPYSGDQDPDFFKKYRKEIGDFLGQDLSGEETFEDYYYFTQSRKHTSVENATKAINGDIPSIDYKPTAQDISKKAKEFDDTTPSGTVHIVGDRAYQGLKFNLKQPKEYGSTKKDTFSIGELSKTEQTVAHKYEEIVNILKQERGDENVEVVTDENGFDWYETQVTPEDLNKPVVAFQSNSADLSAIEQASRDIVNNAITHFEELISKGKEKLRAEKDTAKRKDLQKSILSLQDTQNRLKKNLKDPKFSNDQKFRAAAIDLGNNTFILAALQDPTITSPSHEFFHAAIEGVMTPEEQQAFIDEYNQEFGDKETSWSTVVSEYTARTYEKYLTNGRKLTEEEVPTKKTRDKLQKAFDNFTEWAKNLYNSVIEYNNSKGVTKPINLTPQAQAFFDRVTGIQSQTQTTTDENISTSKSESKTEVNKGKERKVGTTVAEEQRQEGNTQEEVNTESLQTKDPTQKAAQDLVTDSKKTIDELSQDQAAAILDYMKGLKIDISGLKTDCKK